MGLSGAQGQQGEDTAPCRASRAMVELVVETWRLDQLVERTLPRMDRSDADRFKSQYGWFQRVAQEALQELGLDVVDLTGKPYDVGMAATPFNLEDFPYALHGNLVVSQMVDPIVMERGTVRKPGTMMLDVDPEAASDYIGEDPWDITLE